MSDDTIRAVDINSLDLEEDEVQFDAAADSTAERPAIDDGIYLVKPRFGSGSPDWQASTNSSGKLAYLFTKNNMQYVIVEGPYEGQVLFDRGSTMIIQNGASIISTVLAKMGLEQEVGQCRGHSEIAKLFVQAVEQGRELRVETEWEARCDTGQPDPKKPGKTLWKTLKKGQKHFPKDEGGKPLPFVEFNGEQIPAKSRIKHYLAK